MALNNNAVNVIYAGYADVNNVVNPYTIQPADLSTGTYADQFNQNGNKWQPGDQPEVIIIKYGASLFNESIPTLAGTPLQIATPLSGTNYPILTLPPAEVQGVSHLLILVNSGPGTEFRGTRYSRTDIAAFRENRLANAPLVIPILERPTQNSLSFNCLQEQLADVGPVQRMLTLNLCAELGNGGTTVNHTINSGTQTVNNVETTFATSRTATLTLNWNYKTQRAYRRLLDYSGYDNSGRFGGNVQFKTRLFDLDAPPWVSMRGTNQQTLLMPAVNESAIGDISLANSFDTRDAVDVELPIETTTFTPDLLVLNTAISV